jgi:hypothetical protein
LGDQELAPVLARLDEGWEELLDPLLEMRFRTSSADAFLHTLAAIPTPTGVIDRELTRRLWTIPLLLDRIGLQLQCEQDEVYREQFVPWEQSVFVELARILGEPYDLSKR